MKVVVELQILKSGRVRDVHASTVNPWKDSLTDVPASIKMGLEVAESLPAGSEEDWLC